MVCARGESRKRWCDEVRKRCVGLGKVGKRNGTITYDVALIAAGVATVAVAGALVPLSADS